MTTNNGITMTKISGAQQQAAHEQCDRDRQLTHRQTAPSTPAKRSGIPNPTTARRDPAKSASFATPAIKNTHASTTLKARIAAPMMSATLRPPTAKSELRDPTRFAVYPSAEPQRSETRAASPAGGARTHRIARDCRNAGRSRRADAQDESQQR
jgi:hypothetical protein